MDMIAVQRLFDRLIPCKYCGNTEVTAETRADYDFLEPVIRLVHRCPPNVYEGSWYYDIEAAINEWNAYHAPFQAVSESRGEIAPRLALPCRVCGSTEIFYEERTGSRGYYAVHYCTGGKSQGSQRYETPEEVLEAWNRENAPDSPTPAGKTPILADLPALPLPKRGKRQLETVKAALDLEFLEIEVGFREMRSYKNNNLFNNREETVSLRARLKPGQTPEEVYQALREKAGQFVEKAHAEFEAAKQKQAQAEQATQRMLNAFVSPRAPSYFSPNDLADDNPFI